MWQERPKKGLCVDVGTHGNPGVCEYRCVDLATNVVLFHRTIPGISTNNIGEFLALVDALSIGNPVYTDSTTALSWFKKRKCNTNFKVTDEIQKKLIKDAEEVCEMIYQKADHRDVILWNTRAWGDIPADFDRKKPFKFDYKYQKYAPTTLTEKQEIEILKGDIETLKDRVQALEKLGGSLL